MRSTKDLPLPLPDDIRNYRSNFSELNRHTITPIMTCKNLTFYLDIPADVTGLTKNHFLWCFVVRSAEKKTNKQGKLARIVAGISRQLSLKSRDHGISQTSFPGCRSLAVTACQISLTNTCMSSDGASVKRGEEASVRLPSAFRISHQVYKQPSNKNNLGGGAENNYLGIQNNNHQTNQIWQPITNTYRQDLTAQRTLILQHYPTKFMVM